MADEEVKACGQLAYAKFRKQAEDMLTPCCKEPHHRGNHVYCVRVKQGIDRHSHALQYLEEIRRTELKPVMNVDMAGHWRESDHETCAAIWQYFEYVNAGKGSKLP